MNKYLFKNGPKTVIDWSVLMYINWFKMRSPNFEARTNLELAEFSRNITDHLLSLVMRIQPSSLVLALDSSPNWRVGVYNRHYDQETVFWKHKEHQKTWLVQFDKRTYLVKWWANTDSWSTKKLTKKELESYDMEAWAQYSKHGTVNPQDSTVIHPSALDHEDWEELEKIIPKYKGTRAGKAWDFETSKKEFQRVGQNLAHNLAPIFGGQAVKVDLAEGDDICHVFVSDSHPSDTVLVTIDTDLHQELIRNLFLKIFDPKKSEWVEKSPTRAKFELTKKILIGDTADNILGVAKRGQSQTLGEKKATDLIEENGGPDEVWSHLFDEYDEEGKIRKMGLVDQSALQKNLELVSMSFLPDEIEESIRKALGETIKAPDYSLEDFGLTPRDIMTTTATAKRAHQEDKNLPQDGDDIMDPGSPSQTQEKKSSWDEEETWKTNGNHHPENQNGKNGDFS